MPETPAPPARQPGDVLLEVRDLKKHFPIEKGFFRTVKGHVKAVDGVSFIIREGETFGLVGESGSGKTTLGRCVVRAIEPTDGQVFFRLPEGETVDVAELDKQELRDIRKHFHMIFQDPYSSLDPRMSVLEIIAEPIRNNQLLADSRDIQNRVRELMEVVGLDIQHLNRYPHAFSGGQRQRIGIARSLAPNPRLIVCDEAVSALDVSIQAQILNLLEDLQEEFDLTFLFIAHDLSVVEHISDRVGVMYVGKLVEMADTESLFAQPKHPYTEALLSAVPTTDPEIKMDRIILPGEVANPANPPSGCYFHPRCRYAQDICMTDEPQWSEVAPQHFAACHFADELELRGVEEGR